MKLTNGSAILQNQNFAYLLQKYIILHFGSFNILLKDFHGVSQFYSPWFFEPAECELATTDVVKLSIVMNAL